MKNLPLFNSNEMNPTAAKSCFVLCYGETALGPRLVNICGKKIIHTYYSPHADEGNQVCSLP